jgi:hypothetical protein
MHKIKCFSSGFSWLELKSRYLLINGPKSIKGKLNRDKYEIDNKLDLINMLEKTVGINFTVLIILCAIINGLSLYSFAIKWFYEDITVHLFHFLDDDHVHDTCATIQQNNLTNLTNQTLTNITISDQTSQKSQFTLFKTKLIQKLFELLTSFSYFVCLAFLKLAILKCFNMGQNNATITCLQVNNQKNNDSSSSNDNTNTKRYSLKKIGISKILSAILFFSIVFILLSLTFSFSSFKIALRCEQFFKNGFNYVSFNSYMNTNKYIYY